MKHRYLLPALAILIVLGAGCGLPSFLARAPEATAVPAATLRPTFPPLPLASLTPTPSPSPLPTDVPPPTSTPVLPDETPTLAADTPPPAESPTATPEPPTDTPEPPPTAPPPPAATRVPVQPTAAPPPATAAPKAQHVVGAHGVSGLVTARDKTVFAVGEQAWFTYEVLNHTQNPVGFVLLGIKASNGQFNTSWVNPDTIVPNVPFKHDDGLTFNSPGTYKVMLAICFARCDAADADWEEFPRGAATITVK
ncbi:MAG TPA: hypothetical protein VLC52_03915 [Anaerolineae bacterium]|nr:hypothetical protein [Anaerolineae bacterium]